MDGLWTVEFGSSAGRFGGGVAIFQDGKIMGGDGGYYYLGEYWAEGRTFRASVEVSPFIAGYESVFKTAGQTFRLELQGSLTDDNHATAQGRASVAPHLTFGAKLTRRA